MVVDVHTHLFGRDFEAAKKTLLGAMDRYGIDVSYVSAIDGAFHYPNVEGLEEGNAEIAKFCKEQPDRIRGYVYVNPRHPNAMDMLKRGIEEQGMSGVKLWVATTCDAPEVEPLAEKMIEYGVPVLIHSFYKVVGQLHYESTGEHVANLARKFPKLKILMAHLGGNAYHGIPCIRDLPNVWVDYSLSSYWGDMLPYAYEILGAERILHGSDLPGIYTSNLGKILEVDMTEEERELIFWKNSEKLFDRNFKL